MDIFGRESPGVDVLLGDTRGALKKNGDIDLISRFAVYGGIPRCLLTTKYWEKVNGNEAYNLENSMVTCMFSMTFWYVNYCNREV